MYPVSTEYKNKIKENVRTFQAKIQIQHSQGVLELDDKDLAQGSLTYTESSQVGEEFTVGGTVASDISFTILNKPEYENINFIGATVTCNIGLLIETMNDSENYFLQGNYPSEVQMEGGERWEWVPLGRFNIDIADRQRSTIQIKAIDNMINLDKPYSLSKLSYPATLNQIYVNICNVADIPIRTTNFPNKDYVVKVRPDDDLTLRDVLGYVAELAGCFAKCNRHGALELKWYEPTDIELKPMNRFNFKPSDDTVQIKGIMATVEDGTTYLTGTDDYAIDLTENPLLQGDYETVLPNIFSNVKDTAFTPYTSDWQGNPALQAGDMIVQVDRDGKEYNTIVTKSVYKYRGKSSLEARGLPEIVRGYKGSTNRKIAQIKRVVEKEVGDKLTTLEEQQLQATELIANMLGGYAFYEANAFYVADHPDLTQAIRVWKWGIGGFGYSSTGASGPYATAITADGSIVAMLVSAGIVTADMVQTGILQSEDGSTWINLNDGSFNFKNLMRYVDGQLKLNSPDIPGEVDLSPIKDEVSNIRNLVPGTLQGGITTITNEGVRVEHAASDQFSEIRADGFIRKYPYGEAAYLNDIYSLFVRADKQWLSSKPEPLKASLPASFYKRANTELVLVPHPPTQYQLPICDLINYYLYYDTTCSIISSSFFSREPTVTIEAYSHIRAIDSDANPTLDRYYPLDVHLLAIGK